MKRWIGYTLWMLVTLACLTGCDWIWEYPEGPGVDPTLVRVRMELQVDFEPISEPFVTSYADVRGGDYDVRYQIEVYAASGVDAGKRIARLVETEQTLSDRGKNFPFEFDLHAERYDVYTWIDFVPRGTEKDYHYLTGDLRRVRIADPNICGVDTKDAFAGKIAIDLTPYRDRLFAKVVFPVAMERPFGKFKIQTTDVRQFLESYKPGTYTDIVPAETHLTYTGFFPCGYNQDTRLADMEYFCTEVNHTAPVMEYEESSAVLSYDYVFVCSDQTFVTADIEVHNSAGERLNTVKGIRIPIQRNKLTVVKGEFLTTDFSGGGTGIDDGFDGEIVISVPE